MNRRFFMIAIAIIMAFCMSILGGCSDHSSTTTPCVIPANIVVEADTATLANDTKPFAFELDKHFPSENWYPYTELVAEYVSGKWDGEFISTQKHCASIEEDGTLWIDCDNRAYYPDLPDASISEKIQCLGRNSEGTWILNEATSTFQLWEKGELLAESEPFELEYFAGVVNRENGIIFRMVKGTVSGCWQLICARDNLIVWQKATTTQPLTTELPEKVIHAIQKKYFFDVVFWQQVIVVDDQYFHIDYDDNNNQLIVNNQQYSINLDVPYQFMGSAIDSNFAIVDGYAVKFDKGEIKSILPLPEGTVDLIESYRKEYFYSVDSNNTLWKISTNGTHEEIAEAVVSYCRPGSTAGDNLYYVSKEYEAYLYSGSNSNSTLMIPQKVSELVLAQPYFVCGVPLNPSDTQVEYDGSQLLPLFPYEY